MHRKKPPGQKVIKEFNDVLDRISQAKRRGELEITTDLSNDVIYLLKGLGYSVAKTNEAYTVYGWSSVP